MLVSHCVVKAEINQKHSAVNDTAERDTREVMGGEGTPDLLGACGPASQEGL